MRRITGFFRRVKEVAWRSALFLAAVAAGLASFVLALIASVAVSMWVAMLLLYRGAVNAFFGSKRIKIPA